MPMCSMVGSKLSHIVSPYIASWLRIFPARLANLKHREVELVFNLTFRRPRSRVRRGRPRSRKARPGGRGPRRASR
jgi:hypothetical protein